MSESTLILGMLFSCIGFAYFVYGRKQGRAAPLIAGVGLMLFPYLIEGTLWVILVGAVLIVLPYFVRH